MRPFISSALRDDLTNCVRQDLREHGLVNVSRLSEQIRQRNEVENVALEDIEAHVVMFAHSLSAPMEFEPATDITYGVPIVKDRLV